MKKTFSPLLIIISILAFSLIYNTQKVEATSAITSVILPAGYEVQDPATKLWTWIIDVNTTDLSGIQITDTFNGVPAKRTIPSSGINEYEYQNLQDNTSYTISWNISVLYSGSSFANLTATYTCKTGNTANCKATINNQYPQTVVNNVAPTVIPKDENLYKMLAPLGGITCMDSTGQDPNCISNDVGKYLNMIFKLGIGICIFLAVIMLIINGITYMGDESIFGKTEAKHKMFAAILGLIIAIGAWALLNTINPYLTGSGGLSISTASAGITISPTDTSTGSSTSLCLSSTPPDPSTATGTNITLNSTINSTYIPALNSLNLPTGIKLLITAQTYFEGFNSTPAPGTKSYRTNNPGNIGNTDTGATVTYKTLTEGIQAQQKIITNIANNTSTSYKIGGTSKCALGSETYNGYLYQYLRIYATGARTNNNYLNAIIGYFKANGVTITYKTTIADIYNIK